MAIFDAVPSDEVGFAIAIFMSAANGQFRPFQSVSSEAERLDLQAGTELFLRLSFGTMEVVSDSKRSALLRSSLFGGFACVWKNYAGGSRRPSLCARILGFCCLMEKTRGGLVEGWVVPSPEGPEQVILHPAVVEAIANTQLSDQGGMSERVFTADVERIFAGSFASGDETTPAIAAEEPVNRWPIGSGETASLMRARDWSTSSLGPAEMWPQCLRTAIDLTLACHFPMIVLWGAELIQFYNDAYRDIMGTKHPAGVGQPTRECWPEVWQINEPIYGRVLGGETLTFEDQLFPITRYGFLEDAYFTLCYSPVRAASGAVEGVLVTVFETTSRAKMGVRSMDSGLKGEGPGGDWGAVELV